ncbi:uncharacterized protein At2g34160-like [Lotus japonicus]|uniref:uncharacterized protein At2g34160-like n=1 Tax=Lotus japonicus TaxID=34305 RepID=UPI00258FD052|nr:uncharacterized protein At2g34160-like [Lotus japonicus]
MEVTAVTAAETRIAKINGGDENAKKKIVRIQVSKNKKPLFVYLTLAKKYIKKDIDVELCALGQAIPTVIIISEMLKSNGRAIEKNVMISTVEVDDNKEREGRVFTKPKLAILMGKARDVDQSATVAAAAACEEGAVSKA